MSIRLPIEIHEAEDRLIVDAEGYDLAEASYVEYAEFIVRAVNSYDDLLAASERAAQLISSLLVTKGLKLSVDVDEIEATLIDLRLAINKTKDSSRA